MKEFLPFLILISLAWLGSLVFVVALMRSAKRADDMARTFRRGVWSPRPGPPSPAAPPERDGRSEPRRRAPRLSVNPGVLVETRPPRRYTVRQP